MASTPRLTAQGLRDLNYYGPRKVNPAAAAAPEPAVETATPPAEIAAEPAAPAAPVAP